MQVGGELCNVVKWLDAPAAGTTNKRKIVGETQSLTLEQWKGESWEETRLAGLSSEG